MLLFSKYILNPSKKYEIIKYLTSSVFSTIAIYGKYQLRNVSRLQEMIVRWIIRIEIKNNFLSNKSL